MLQPAWQLISKSLHKSRFISVIQSLSYLFSYQNQVPRKKKEEILREVATEISEAHKDIMKRLGKEMGFKSKEIKIFRKANRAGNESKSAGAMEMLQSWATDMPPDRMLKDLKVALRRAELQWVADKCLPACPVVRSADETAPSLPAVNKSTGIKVC